MIARRRAALGVLLLLAACSRRAADGSKVSLHYTLSVEGSVYESSEGGRPLDIVLGSGEVIAGLEEVLRGMKAGDEKEASVPPERGYGPYDPGAVQKIGIEKFGAMASGLKAGLKVEGMRGGKPASARIAAVDSRAATLDFNHPLAGKTLTFRVRILAVD